MYMYVSYSTNRKSLYPPNGVLTKHLHLCIHSRKNRELVCICMNVYLHIAQEYVTVTHTSKRVVTHEGLITKKEHHNFSSYINSTYMVLVLVHRTLFSYTNSTYIQAAWVHMLCTYIHVQHARLRTRMCNT